MVDEKALTVDALAQEIRRVDGNHSLGAGALAEALMPFITGALSPGSTGEAEGWRDIESAPKDGTRVDLWMSGSDSRSFREADAYYVYGAWEETVEYREDGSFAVIRRQRDGWFAPNHDYEGQDGLCDTPKRFNDHPLQKKWIWCLPTHWRPLPAPPSAMLSAAGER